MKKSSSQLSLDYREPRGGLVPWASIVLSNDVGEVEIETVRETMCVYHPGVGAPRISAPRVKMLEYRELEGRIDEANQAGLLVVAGLNRIITPSNRTRTAAVLLHRITGPKKISVDTALYVVHPWRTWFHFGLVGATYDYFTYSFIAESRYNAWLEGVAPDNPFAVERVVEKAAGITVSMCGKSFDHVDVEVFETDAGTKAAYAALKESYFETETTLAAIIGKLSEFAAGAYPGRLMPAMSKLTPGNAVIIRRTDLGVDAFLERRVRAYVDFCNEIAERTYRGPARGIQVD